MYEQANSLKQIATSKSWPTNRVRFYITNFKRNTHRHTFTNKLFFLFWFLLSCFVKIVCFHSRSRYILLSLVLFDIFLSLAFAIPNHIVFAMMLLLLFQHFSVLFCCECSQIRFLFVVFLDNILSSTKWNAQHHLFHFFFLLI